MTTFIRLTNYKSSDEKEQEFFNPENRYESKQEDFEKVPGRPIAYWVGDIWFEIFAKLPKLAKLAFASEGIKTGNNERFLRNWFEVNKNDTGDINTLTVKWVFHHKGGEFRKWYGNIEYVIFWLDNGKLIKSMPNSGIQGESTFRKDASIWSDITSGGCSARLKCKSHTFDSASPAGFLKNYDNELLLPFLNSSIVQYLTPIINPTLHFKVGNFKALPFAIEKIHLNNASIKHLAQQNIDISKEEWDSRETSWDFKKNELLKHKQDGSLENALNAYKTYWRKEFVTLHRNEEELNRLFIEIYGLQDELDEYVDFKDITILKNEAKVSDILIPAHTIDEVEEGEKTPEGYIYYRGAELEFQKDEIIKQFISYAVGCMFGRYTLDNEGLVVANLGQKIPTDTTYEIDDDNIIPIVDESDYFSDDMTDRFTEFVRTTFGAEHLQQNISFIESAIGKKLRTYFVKDFYKDHVKRYKKRPIYWLLSSPKGTFQTLIYMHRYTPDTLNNILNDYLRPFRIRLDTMRNEAMRTTEREDVTPREKTEADKKIDKIDKTLDDINAYEKVLAHYAAQRIEIDLDDGVKVNYCKFKELLVEFDKKLCK